MRPAARSCDGHRPASTPTGIAYAATTGQLWVSNETGGSETVVDAGTGRVVGTVPLGGGAGNLAFDPGDGSGSGAGPGRRAVPQAARDDRPGQPGSAAAVGSTQPVGDKPDVLALDRSTGWLYVAGEGGKVTVVADRGRSLTALGSDHLAGGAHIVAVDPLTHRSYLPIPDGTGGRPELLIRRPCRGRDSACGPRKAAGP